jgi:hypothetical protein
MVSLLLLISWIVLSFIEGGSVFKWINSLHYFFWTIFMFFLGYGKMPFYLFGKAYFKIDYNGIIYKPSIFRKEIVQYYWSEIDDIKVKLFEVELKIKEKWVSINLEKFSDDNLKSVKETFKEIQLKIAKEGAGSNITSLNRNLQFSDQ